MPLVPAEAYSTVPAESLKSPEIDNGAPLPVKIKVLPATTKAWLLSMVRTVTLRFDAKVTVPLLPPLAETCTVPKSCLEAVLSVTVWLPPLRNKMVPAPLV